MEIVLVELLQVSYLIRSLSLNLILISVKVPRLRVIRINDRWHFSISVPLTLYVPFSRAIRAYDRWQISRAVQQAMFVPVLRAVPHYDRW
jgi:hypothetical protein